MFGVAVTVTVAPDAAVLTLALALPFPSFVTVIPYVICSNTAFTCTAALPIVNVAGFAVVLDSVTPPLTTCHSLNS